MEEKKLKVFFDTEFTGLHRDTNLISIGLTTEYGAWFYAEFNDYDSNNIDEWIQKHVIDNLLFNDKNKFISIIPIEKDSISNDSFHYHEKVKGSSNVIRSELLNWLKNELELSGLSQVQMYSDCYAYDWMLFNDLICKDGKALNLPEFINYIPIDLSTALYMAGFDPDINREEFVSEYYNDKIQKIKLMDVFESCKNDPKHNSLWDALIITLSFHRIFHQLKNGRKYPEDIMKNKLSSDNVDGIIGDKKFIGEMSHPSN